MDKEAELFKVLGDPLRLRLVILLAREDELCVCKLVDAVGGTEIPSPCRDSVGYGRICS